MSILCNLKREGRSCSFEVKSDLNFANAIRRSLLERVVRYSPDNVEIEVNTTSQTDEYISHRIGLLPFDLSSQGKDLMCEEDLCAEVDVKDRDFLTTDIKGAFLPSNSTTVLRMVPGQRFKAKIRFRKDRGSSHARFSHVDAVSFRESEEGVKMGFSMLTNEDPGSYLESALTEILEELKKVLAALKKESKE